MYRMFRLFILLLGFNAIAGKANAGDTLIVQSSLKQSKWFSYRVITQEYITNVNDFFLDLKLDTFFMVVRSTGKPFEYKLNYYQDEKYTQPVKKNDPLLKSEYIIRFDPISGKAVELLNWKTFRDQMLSDLSFQAANKLISSSEFDEYKQLLNSEPWMRKTVMHDITYVFSIYGDTIRTDAEYLKIKPVRSPMSGKDYAILGSFTSELPAGTRNTVVFHARNKAGELEKPELMEEVKAYMFKTYPKDSPLPELTAVGLNSEMDWQYNRIQRQMLRISIADVLAINGQSRGNIRTFDLWDKE
jgi:hypothetical protein